MGFYPPASENDPNFWAGGPLGIPDRLGSKYPVPQEVPRCLSALPIELVE